MGFSDNLRRIRKSKGYTQKELAAMLDTSVSTIAMWETDCRHPDYDNLAKLTNIFGISFDEMLCDSDALERAKQRNYAMDEDVAAVREMIRTRPEFRTLFSVSESASKADIERAITVIAALKGTDQDDN